MYNQVGILELKSSIYSYRKIYSYYCGSISGLVHMVNSLFQHKVPYNDDLIPVYTVSVYKNSWKYGFIYSGNEEAK